MNDNKVGRNSEVVCEMDEMLMAKLQKVCRSRGLRFPEDLSILLGEVCTPDAAQTE